MQNNIRTYNRKRRIKKVNNKLPIHLINTHTLLDFINFSLRINSLV